MQDTNKLDRVAELVEMSQTILVIVKENPSLDQLASASSLYLGLTQKEKEVLFLVPNESVMSKHQLAGLSKATSQIGKQNLVVSFDYEENSVDKVSYHIGEESKKFFLTVKPKKGSPPLDQKTVEFNYTGIDADLIFLVGVDEFDSLGHLYYGYESMYADVPVVSINSYEARLGTISLNTAGYSSTSEAMVSLLERLQMSVTDEIATNLLGSIEHATNHFSSIDTTAGSFEVAAKLLRAGARRTKLKSETTLESKSVKPKIENKVEIEVKKKSSSSDKSAKSSGLKHQPGGIRK